MTRRSRQSAQYISSFLLTVFLAACTAQPSSRSLAGASGGSDMQTDQARQDQLLHGRALVVNHACGDCHGGGSNPAAFGWLDGARSEVLDVQFFKIGPFTTRSKNLTPDNTTGTGRFKCTRRKAAF